MKICVFASGSSGNCLLVSDGVTHILLDAGISMRRIEASLRQTGLSLSDISGVLITHEHSDHVSALGMITKHYAVPIYAPRTVAARLIGSKPEIEPCLRVIETGLFFGIGTLKVRAFHTPHDTDESVGYRVEGNGVFALATDMGHVTDEVFENLSGADAVLVESNHDVEMLSYGPYPVYLKRRILSMRGHLSNECCAELVQRLAKTGVKKVILGHLSRENNTPEKAYLASAAALRGTGVELQCAPASGALYINI